MKADSSLASRSLPPGYYFANQEKDNRSPAEDHKEDKGSRHDEHGISIGWNVFVCFNATFDE